MITAESAAVKSHFTSEISRANVETQAHVTAESKAAQDNLTKRFESLQFTTAMDVKREKLLLSLKYDGMNGRSNMITNSHTNTFQWIYSRELQTWSSFVDWLGSTEKIYWISGKPGSGKSTLMKFMVHDKRTSEFLAPNTVILSYYLWSVGNSMQRSIKGIFLSLIYQLLLDDQILVASGFLNSTAFNMKSTESDWSLSELGEYLRNILLKYTPPRPVCIFLDGLDEISPSEGPLDIIEMVDELSTIPGVKFCVSSRPEPAFKRRYMSMPNLRLQDLTKPDMRKVCEDVLKHHRDDVSEIGLLPGEGQKAFSGLINEVLRKAEGVFLWVCLALKSIRRGYSNSDSWEDLRKRLDALPSDLDELYSSMWKRANVDQGIYEHTASLYLNLILESRKLGFLILMRDGISAFELVVASEDSIQAAILKDEDGLTPAELETRCRFIMRNIEARCAGLIEFGERNDDDIVQFKSRADKWDDLLPFSRVLVNFVHRTASDFLTDTEGGKKILQMDKTTLESRRMRFIRLYLVQQTLWPLNKFDFQHARWNDRVGSTLIIAKRWIKEDAEDDIEEVQQYCEKVWGEVCLIRKETCPAEQLPDFLGLLASAGFSSTVQAKVGSLEADRGHSISSRYKDYLLHGASHAATTFWYPKVADGGLQLMRWLHAGGACFSTHFFDISERRTFMASNISLETPSMVILRGIINELAHSGNWDGLSVSRGCSLYSIVQRINDLIGQVVKVRADISANQKMALELYWHDEPESRPVWINTLKRTVAMVDPSSFHGCCLEVNMAFLLRLFKDVVEVQAQKLGLRSDTTAIMPFQWTNLPNCPASVRLLCYSERGSGQPLVRKPQAECFLQEDQLCSIIKANFQPGIRTSGFKRLRSELINYILEAVGETETVELQTREAWWELFKEYSFSEWPPQAEFAMEYPPPMFT